LPARLEQDYRIAIEMVEKRLGSRFADPKNPLLLPVRSGAPISMPGMMNTILNLGLNDEIVEGLALKPAIPDLPTILIDGLSRWLAMLCWVLMVIVLNT
jgi:pyruvate, orthophosphate dikinase